MNSATGSLHDQKVKSLAQQYIEKGFQVIVEPEANQLPFDLRGYRPDLIAQKGNDGEIVEVKTRSNRVSVEKYQEIAQEVSKHPGWRFLLVTLDDVEESAPIAAIEDLPSWRKLLDGQKQVLTLIENGVLEPALLFQWGLFESALRKRALASSIPIQRFPVAKLLDQLYSQGEIPFDQVDDYKKLLYLRNRASHGFNTAISKEELLRFSQSISALLNNWSAEDSNA